ncbi:MAG: crossover junction endodeoxyribonuclease RuvC [Actinomycetota bacterium]
MGIDPGLTRMGVGVVEGSGQRLQCLDSRTITTPTNEGTAARLRCLRESLSEALSTWQPEEVAVERVFYNLNARTAVPVIQASGVALLVAAEQGARVYEYTPPEVKRAVVGTGKASKEQVCYMVGRLLALRERPDTIDAADALALAICHLHFRSRRALSEAPP